MEIWVSISQSIKWCQIRSYEGYEATPELRVEGMDVSDVSFVMSESYMMLFW
jgi:hypothetical protein